ncbi:MAG: hypothetical protein JOY79_01595 [Acidobacteriaceae bacterium]|nr:hypothetical protein [Acidobacteriaceae bacterium]
MEQLLNLIWLLAVAAMVVALKLRPNRIRHLPAYRALVVFCCMALLLFPVISASDDLHAAYDLSDEAAWRHDKRLLGVPFVAVLLLVFSHVPLVLRPTRSFLSHIQLGSLHHGYLRLDLGRAPPFAC